MKLSAATTTLAVVLLALTASLAPARLLAQASEIPSAAPPVPAGETSEQRGRTLLDQMVQALGGDLWLNRVSIQFDGRGSSFFHGAPNPYIIEYHEAIRLARPSATPPIIEADRVGFLTDRGMILPGKKVDVVQIFTAGHGYEITFKGKTELPKEQVDDYNRRQAHSIEEVVRTWIHAPGVMIVYEGAGTVERHMVDKVTVLTATNDAATLELDATTHLPIRRTFQWHNPQFNDFDEEAETYDDYHTIQGLPTALTITRYHDGDMSSQRFLTKVVYNEALTPDLFNPDAAVPKLKK